MRIMAIDYSQKCTAVAIGEPGRIPRNFYSLGEVKNEAVSLLAIVKRLGELFWVNDCKLVVAEELTVSRNMQTTRILGAIRGAILLHFFERFGVETIFINSNSARKHAGVNMTREFNPKTGKKNLWPKGEAKRRVAIRMQELGVRARNDDEADAAVLLIASKTICDFKEGKTHDQEGKRRLAAA